MQRLLQIVALASLGFVLTGPVVGADEAPATAATSPAMLVVWDGEAHKAGGGWAEHKDKEHAKTQEVEAHSGKVAIELGGEGDKWHGYGWNWTMWKAADAADVTPYKNLVFWVKMTGETKPAELKISLASTTGKMTGQVDAVKYCPKLMEGQWQQVVIPLKDMMADHEDFDPKKVWELEVGNWNQAAVKFVVYIDDIGFSNAPADAAK